MCSPPPPNCGYPVSSRKRRVNPTEAANASNVSRRYRSLPWRGTGVRSRWTRGWGAKSVMAVASGWWSVASDRRPAWSELTTHHSRLTTSDDTATPWLPASTTTWVSTTKRAQSTPITSGPERRRRFIPGRVASIPPAQSKGGQAGAPPAPMEITNQADRAAGSRTRSIPATAASPLPSRKGAAGPKPGQSPMPCHRIPVRRLAGKATNPTTAW